MATLTCKQCGHVNEDARIYCHNCGVKLDRSLLEEEAPVEPTTEKSRQRIKKMMNPSRFPISAWFRLVVNALLSGAVVASLISSVRPPDGVPPMPKKGDLVEAPAITMELERVKEMPLPQKVALPEEGINAYLLKAIKQNQPSSLTDRIKFVRAFVHLEEGVCRISMQQSFFDYSLYAGTDYKLEIKDGKLLATNVGGNVGRLPIHPKIMEFAGKYVFQTLWDSLSREQKLMDGMQSIEVHKGQIDLVTKPMGQ